MKVEDVMSKDVVSVSENDSLSKAIRLMAKYKFHQLPVINDKFEGMVYLKRILKVKSDLTKTKVKKLVESVIEIKKEENLIRGIKLLLETGKRALPVTENGKVVGIFSESDIITKGVKIPKLHVENIMNKPIVINENDSLKKAIRIMEKNNISSLPVVNWEEKLVGCINIFSFAEFLSQEKIGIESLKSGKEKKNFLNNPVKHFSFSPITCNKNEEIEKVVNYFKTREEVIVVENGKPIGIVKPRDILSLFAEKEKSILITSGIKREEVETVLGRTLEKWKKMNVRNVFIMVEKIGAKEKYEGKIKIVVGNEILILSSIAFDKTSLIRALRDMAERKILELKERKLSKG